MDDVYRDRYRRHSISWVSIVIIMVDVYYRLNVGLHHLPRFRCTRHNTSVVSMATLFAPQRPGLLSKYYYVGYVIIIIIIMVSIVIR